MQSWNALAQMTVEKGGDLKSLPPQPKPADYGYDPAQSNPATASQVMAPPVQQVAGHVNNITNNITDNRGS